MNLKEEVLREEVIYRGNITQYEVWDVELADGQTATREIVKHDDASAVMALDEDGRMIFVRQYRVAIGQNTLEIPAGLIDDADASPLEAAKRELEEETGIGAKEWEKVCGFYHSPGFCDEYLHIFLAKELHQVENPRAMDADENLEVLALSYEEALDYYLQGEICDSKSVYALLYWQKLLQSSEK